MFMPTYLWYWYSIIHSRAVYTFQHNVLCFASFSWVLGCTKCPFSRSSFLFVLSLLNNDYTVTTDKHVWVFMLINLKLLWGLPMSSLFSLSYFWSLKFPPKRYFWLALVVIVFSSCYGWLASLLWFSFWHILLGLWLLRNMTSICPNFHVD
jgi:hypothetical protein